MTKGKHTPGPWHLVWWGNEEYPYPLSVVADGAWIARNGTTSSEANAHLIAAAPDLLDALTGALDSLLFAQAEIKAQAAIPEDDSEMMQDRIDAARAAIAKARGQS